MTKRTNNIKKQDNLFAFTMSNKNKF